MGGNRFILLLIEQVVAVPERPLLCSHRYLVKIHMLFSLSSVRCDTKTTWPARSGKSETLCGPLTHITTYIIQSQANLCLVTWITLWSQNVIGHARWSVSHICWIYYGKEHVEDVEKGTARLKIKLEK